MCTLTLNLLPTDTICSMFLQDLLHIIYLNVDSENKMLLENRGASAVRRDILFCDTVLILTSIIYVFLGIYSNAYMAEVFVFLNFLCCLCIIWIMILMKLKKNNDPEVLLFKYELNPIYSIILL